MEDIRSMLLANAADTSAAQKSFTTEMNMILEQLETGDYSQIEKQLNRTAATLARIPLKRPPKLVPTIALVGEIFVRRDALSRQQITERLACKGFATVCAPVAEWLHYCDYLMENGLADQRLSTIGRLKLLFKKKSMFRYEKRIKTTLSRSGLVHSEPIDVRSLIRHATPYISPQLTGEAILTIASSLAEVVSHACGVIAIGPFGCMPNRLSEAILNETMNRGAKLATDPHNAQLQAVLADVDDLPFLAIESDGSPFPQIINAKLEAFCLRALRLHARMRSAHDAEVASRGKAAKPKT
jgi:predicted nucleotide-binding protein (sugar kinase/HSP70/actin superfamily)